MIRHTLTALLVSATCALAQPVIMDFEDVGIPAFPNAIDSYEKGGYVISIPTDDEMFVANQDQAPDGGDSYYLSVGTPLGGDSPTQYTIILQQESGLAFNLNSLNHSARDGSGFLDWTAVGTLAGGGTVMGTYSSSDQSPQFLDFDAEGGWENLVSVEITMGVRQTFDNITVTPVPEPSVVLLLALGLGAVVCRRLASRSR